MGNYFFGLAGFCLKLAQLLMSLLDMRRRKKSTTFVMRMRITIKTKNEMGDMQRSSRRKR